MAAEVNMDFVISLARRYTKAELLVKIDETSMELEEFMNAQVIVTSANMKESGTSGEYRQGEIERKLASYRAAYNYKCKLASGNSGRVNERMTHLNFQTRIWGF